MSKSVTMQDVARKAGVSVGTVSRGMNDCSNIGGENLQRVRAAVEELGYVKCESAQLLARRRAGGRQKTGNIGVFLAHMSVEWADHPLVSTYMAGIERACASRGYHYLVEFADQAEGAYPRFLAENKVDGLLLKGAMTHEILGSVTGHLPVVGMGMYEPGLSIPQVAPDNHLAGREVAAYLWARGHRRIAFMSDHSQHPMFIYRRQGVEAFISCQRDAESRLLVAEETRAFDAVGTPQAALPSMVDLVARVFSPARDERPTAIVAANDWTAAGIYNALQDRGIRPGQDVSILAFDNAIQVACSLRPPLTSYDLPIEETAFVATRILLDRIDSDQDQQPSSIQLIPGRLVERESVSEVSSTSDAANTEPALSWPDGEFPAG